MKRVINDVFGSIPVIGPHLPKVEVHGRERPQWDIEKEVFARVKDIPDVRILKLNDRGERDLSFNFLSKNEKDLNEAVGLLESKLRAEPLLANVSAEAPCRVRNCRFVPARTRPPASASRRSRSPIRSVSPRSATSMRRLPRSTSTTARSRSAFRPQSICDAILRPSVR
ncbi:hypothetical protein AJ87_22125 [Rhizobium yanglingense]|nr:hypothetical protein AJ87_22125 [Rhizobium yanglingense]